MVEGLVKCFSCGRRKEKEGIGRVIDGLWVDDFRLWRTEVWGTWVCSLRCYWDVVERYGWRYVLGCDGVDE
jgi:hypothetical protein